MFGDSAGRLAGGIGAHNITSMFTQWTVGTIFGLAPNQLIIHVYNTSSLHRMTCNDIEKQQSSLRRAAALACR